jgi:nicotinamidase-related amidase
MHARQRRLNAERSTLVLVDYQARLMPAIFEGERVVAEALRLAEIARLLEVPVLGTEQNPAGLGQNIEALRQHCARTLPKMHFDACEDGLLDAIGESPEVVIAGCEAHVCLLQTALGLLRAGREVAVLVPACGSRQPADRDLAMQRLRDAGALLVSTEMVVFEWLHECRHARFKDVLARIKNLPR